MSSTFGKNFKVSLFGESHGPAIGVMIDGIAPKIPIDYEFIDAQLLKRRPQAQIGTARAEADHYQFVSGVFNDQTTGAPLVILIENKDKRSQDYGNIKNLYRPSHADYGLDVKSLETRDYRGGGVSSGRVTAALVIAGALAIQILEHQGIKLATKIIQVDDIEDISFRSEENLFDMQVELINKNIVPAVCPQKAQEIYDLIVDVKNSGDSLGAKMQTQVLNVEAGIGEPYFDGLDAKLAQALMSVGAIKGVEFGLGFDYLAQRGSQSNDSFEIEEDQIVTQTNHAGGIVGGLSNGMPLVINTIVKPTPSISLEQEMYDKETKEIVKTAIQGRHDPAIFPRIGVVLDSVVAMTLVDAYSERYGYLWQRSEMNEKS